MIPILTQELSTTAKEKEADQSALCAVLQDSILLFGETLLMYLETHLTHAMNSADEQASAENAVGTAYWNGRYDLCSQLIDMLRPLSQREG